jgi:nitroreductase
MRLQLVARAVAACVAHGFRRKPGVPLLRSQPHTAPVCALQLGPPAAAAAAAGGGGKPRLATASDDCTVCLLAAHDLRSEARLAAHDDFAR